MRLCVFILAICLSALSYAEQIIRVQGSGQVLVQPELLSFTITLEEQGKLVGKLNQSLASKSGLVFSVFEDAGIPLRDIEAQNLQLAPWMDYERREQKGFVLSRTMVVTIRNFDTIGSVVDALFRIGVARLGQFNYRIADQQSHYNDALVMALNNGKDKAALLAKQAGLKVGELLHMEELSAIGIQPTMMQTSRMESSDLSFVPGQISVTAHLDLKFLLE